MWSEPCPLSDLTRVLTHELTLFWRVFGRADAWLKRMTGELNTLNSALVIGKWGHYMALHILLTRVVVSNTSCTNTNGSYYNYLWWLPVASILVIVSCYIMLLSCFLIQKADFKPHVVSWTRTRELKNSSAFVSPWCSPSVWLWEMQVPTWFAGLIPASAGLQVFPKSSTTCWTDGTTTQVRRTVLCRAFHALVSPLEFAIKMGDGKALAWMDWQKVWNSWKRMSMFNACLLDQVDHTLSRLGRAAIGRESLKEQQNWSRLGMLPVCNGQHLVTMGLTSFCSQMVHTIGPMFIHPLTHCLRKGGRLPLNVCSYQLTMGLMSYSAKMVRCTGTWTKHLMRKWACNHVQPQKAPGRKRKTLSYSYLRPSDIRFSHHEIGPVFSNGKYSIKDTFLSLHQHELQPEDLPLMYVVNHHGQYVSISNRRLAVYRLLEIYGKSNLQVPVEVVQRMGSFSSRYSTKCEGKYAYLRHTKYWIGRTREEACLLIWSVFNLWFSSNPQIFNKGFW